MNSFFASYGLGLVCKPWLMTLISERKLWLVGACTQKFRCPDLSLVTTDFPNISSNCSPCRSHLSGNHR